MLLYYIGEIKYYENLRFFTFSATKIRFYSPKTDFSKMGFRSVRDAYLRRYGVFKAISAEFDKKVRFFHRFQSKNVIFCCSIIVVKWMDRFLHVMSHPKYSYFWLRKVVHTMGKLIHWTKNISSPWDGTLIFDKIFTIFKAFCSTYSIPL